MKAFKKRIKKNNSQNSSKNKETKNNSFLKKNNREENIKKFKKLSVPKISKSKKVVNDPQKFVEKLFWTL